MRSLSRNSTIHPPLRRVLVRCRSKNIIWLLFADMWRPHNFTVDLIKSILSAPKVLPAILPALVPYTLVVAAFGAFIAWNGGIVLGQFL